MSRPTAHRAKRKLEDMGRRLRESRLLMEGMGAGLGLEEENRQGRALLELLRTLVFEFQQALLKEGGAEGLESKDYAYLGRTVKDLMQAMRLNQDSAERAVAAERERAVAVVSRAGLSADTAAAIRAAIEGGGEPRRARPREPCSLINGVGSRMRAASRSSRNHGASGSRGPRPTTR